MNVYVSITSIFQNQTILISTLKSILKQTYKPTKCFIYLSEEPYLKDLGFKNKELSNDLNKLIQENNIFEIKWCKNDGPYRKLLPLLKEKWEEDCLIITIDDDTEYDKDLIRNYVNDYNIHKYNLNSNIVIYKNDKTLEKGIDECIKKEFLKLELIKCVSNKFEKNINFFQTYVYRRRKSNCLITLNIGNRPYLNYTKELMEIYSKRINCDFKIITNYNTKLNIEVGRNNNKSYLYKSLVINEYLNYYDKVLLIDDTCCINKKTPDIFELTSDDNISGVIDGNDTTIQYDKNFIFKIKNFKILGDKYINTGVICVPKKFSYLFNEENIVKNKELFLSSFVDQCYINYIIQYNNININLLPIEYNNIFLTSRDLNDNINFKDINYEYILKKFIMHGTGYYKEDFRINYIKNICNLFKMNENFNILIITNKGFLNFTYNFLKNVENLGLKYNIIIACLDEECYKELGKINLSSNFTLAPYFEDKLKDFKTCGTLDYKKLVFKKLDIYYDILDKYLDKDIIYIDLDIYLFKDPIPHLLNYTKNKINYDIYFQCDEVVKVCVSCKPCSGFMYIRNNESTRKLFKWKSICSEQEAYTFSGNQGYLRKYMDKIIKWTTLPSALYPNGSFIDDIPKDALILHYNFIIGETQKIFNMIKNDHWLIDFDYKYMEDLCRFILSNQMTLKEYVKICEVIKVKTPCNILVYGLGNDSFLYHFLNKNGYTFFIENDKEWINKIGKKYSYLNYGYFNFPTTVENSLKTKFNSDVKTPYIKDKEWDIIIIDGPPGYEKNKPGREIPIKEAAEYFNSSSKSVDVFIHDVNRVLESSACNKFFKNNKPVNYDISFHYSK
jgi:hypothetical protein